MHVAIVGAGALGRIYGVRLAASGAARVSFVVRAPHLGDVSPFVVEEVSGARARSVVASPVRRNTIPEDATAVLVAVRFEALEGVDPELVGIVRGAPEAAPIVVLTPLLPGVRMRIEQASGKRLVPALPGAAGYVDAHGTVRAWFPRAVATLLEADTPFRPVVESLAQALSAAGVPARLERDVERLDAGTTIAFYPFVAAIGAAGSVDAALGDAALLATTLSAAKEAEALAREYRVASWSSGLMKFVGPFTLKPGVALAKRLAPEAVRFVDEHFGPKLAAQHLAMGRAITELARARGLPVPALERLVARLPR